MKLKPFAMVTGLFAVVFFSSMAGYIFGAAENKKPQERVIPALPIMIEPLPGIRSTKDSSPTNTASASFTESYILKEQDGKPALFIRYANGDEEIYSTFDSAVSLLPEQDREALKKGIEFDSISDALQLAEDYAE